MRRVRFGLCVDRSTAISTRVRLFRLFLLIPCWESQRLIPKRSAGPRATKIGVVSLKALDHHRPNREESFIRIRLQSSSTTHRFGPIAERHGPADPRFEAAILSHTRSPSSQRARAKVYEGPFASLNATRRKLTPGTWLAISALHLVENRLDVAAAGLQWTSFSRLPRSILAIAAGADFEHLALPRNWPDRSISLDKDVSHRDSPAKYAVAYFESHGRSVWASARQGGL